MAIHLPVLNNPPPLQDLFVLAGADNRPRAQRTSVEFPAERQRTINVARIPLSEWVRSRALYPEAEHLDALRPKTPADCMPGGTNEARPCPWVGCEYHLYLEVNEVGNMQIVFPDHELEDMPATCLLDVLRIHGPMDNGDTIARYLNITHQQVFNRLRDSLRKLREELSKEVMGLESACSKPLPGPDASRATTPRARASTGQFLPKGRRPRGRPRKVDRTKPGTP